MPPRDRSDRALENLIDAWAHDYANDAWRELPAEEQMQAAERIAAAYVAARGMRDLVADVRIVLDTVYPADIFGRPGDKGIDPGSRFTIKLREALQEVEGTSADPSR